MIVGARRSQSVAASVDGDDDVGTVDAAKFVGVSDFGCGDCVVTVGSERYDFAVVHIASSPSLDAQ